LKSFTYNFIPILLLVILNIAIIFKLPQRASVSQCLPLKIATDLFLSFFILFMINQLFFMIASQSNPDLRVDHVGTILSNILIFLCMEVVYYIIRSRESIKRAEAARREAIQYQYDALKAQVNPHFLFNSLNILYSLISIDTVKSKEFVLSLSQMYRYIMSQQNKKTIKLKEELDFLHSYIAVLKMRYHNQFNSEMIGADIIVDQEIIPYTLQLLIENVTKHNIISTKYPMTVNITICDKHVTVSNSIKKKDNETVSGIGLNYIMEQYKLYDKVFEVKSNGETFVAKVPYL
jgi:Putative regulator of cell autolysis